MLTAKPLPILSYSADPSALSTARYVKVCALVGVVFAITSITFPYYAAKYGFEAPDDLLLRWIDLSPVGRTGSRISAIADLVLGLGLLLGSVPAFLLWRFGRWMMLLYAVSSLGVLLLQTGLVLWAVVSNASRSPPAWLTLWLIAVSKILHTILLHAFFPAITFFLFRSPAVRRLYAPKAKGENAG